MPKRLNAEEELKQAYAAMKTDPAHRFKVITGITSATYAKVIEQCIETGKPLSHTIDRLLGDYFKLKESAACGGTALDAPNRDRLKALMTIWNCPPEEAIRKLLERGTETVLRSEIENRKKEKAQLDSLMEQVGAGA